MTEIVEIRHPEGPGSYPAWIVYANGNRQKINGPVIVDRHLVLDDQGRWTGDTHLCLSDGTVKHIFWHPIGDYEYEVGPEGYTGWYRCQGGRLRGYAWLMWNDALPGFTGVLYPDGNRDLFPGSILAPPALSAPSTN
jgi:hypothetical protein